MHLNDIESKLAYFEYILSDYFAILIFFEFDFGQPETVFGFLQVCTRMTFRFNRLNSTGFISSLKIGMKKLKFWARSFGSGKRYFGVSRKQSSYVNIREQSKNQPKRPFEVNYDLKVIWGHCNVGHLRPCTFNSPSSHDRFECHFLALFLPLYF